MANPQCENGYTKIANEIMEALAHIRISGEARQVLDFIFRKTYGWNKKEDRISLSQFNLATGLKKPTIIKALNKLFLMNLITKKDNAITQKDNARGNIYRFNKDFDTWKPLPKKITTYKSLPKKVKGVTKKGNKSLPKKIPTKETIQKTTITKESNPKGLQPYGRDDINQIISFLKEKLGGSPDGSIKQNRQFANLLIGKIKKDYPDKDPVEQIKALISFGLQDEFHGKNITSFRYLYHNAQKIIQSVKKKVSSVAIIRREK